MNEDAVHAFLTALVEDAALRKELLELAARHGFDVSDEALADADLDAVAGGLSLRDPSSATVAGFAGIDPGTSLDLRGLGDRFSGEPYVEGTTHSFGDGYTSGSDSDGG